MWSLLCASEELISPSGAKRQQCREQDKNRRAKAARGFGLAFMVQLISLPM